MACFVQLTSAPALAAVTPTLVVTFSICSVGCFSINTGVLNIQVSVVDTQCGLVEYVCNHGVQRLKVLLNAA